VPSRRAPVEARRPITAERIARAALAIVRESGYARLSMRAVANRLDTGQASLYAHIRNKADLDRLLITTVFDENQRPDSGSWRDRLADSAAQTLRTYAKYPGLALAAFASAPRSERFLDDFESDLELLCSTGMDLREALVVQVAQGLVVAARSLEDATIAERIAESGLSPTEWWTQVRSVMAADAEGRPLSAQSSTWLDPDSRDWMAAEIIELILDGAQFRYGISAPRSHAHDRGAAKRTTPVVTRKSRAATAASSSQPDGRP
jgi:AcrR family transcriptional regulator